MRIRFKIIVYAVRIFSLYVYLIHRLVMKINKYKNKIENKKNPGNQNPCHSSFSCGIICGPHRGSFSVRDHLRSNLGIISGLGIICGRGSFAALYSAQLHIHLHTLTFKPNTKTCLLLLLKLCKRLHEGTLLNVLTLVFFFYRAQTRN